MRRRVLPCRGPLASIVSLLLLFVLTPLAVDVGVAQEAAVAPAAEAQAQNEAPKPLTLDDYNRWRTVEGITVSADGRWAAYGYRRQRQADDELRIRSLVDDRDRVVERGADASLSDDGRWAAYRVAPGWEEIEALEKDGEPVPMQAQLMELDSGATWTWDDVASITMPRGSLALAVKRKKSDEDAEHDGTDLIVRYLAAGSEELLGSVDELAFNKQGTHLAYTVDAADDNGNGLYLIDLPSGTRRALDNAKKDYARLVWNESGESLAVLRGTKPEGMEERVNVLITVTGIGDGGAPTRRVYASDEDEAFPDRFVISERGQVRWNDPGDRVFFGIKEQVAEPEKTDEPIADVNVFHWNDDRIQTVQKAQARRDRDFTHLSVLNLGSDRFVRLGTDRLRRFQLTDDGRWAIGFDERDYISDWQPRYADLYRVDTATGDVTPMVQEQLRTYGLSPDGSHFLYWRDGQMWSWELDTGNTMELTAATPLSFVNAEWDYFGAKPAYGVAGWSADGGAVVLYHRYDLWRIPLDGSPGTDLTGGFGARHEIRLRYVRVDPDAKAIDLSRPQILSAYGQWTKKAGLYELVPAGGDPRPLLWADKIVGRPMKARLADRYLFTLQAFHQFPDVWTAEYTLGAATSGERPPVGASVAYGDDNGDDPVASGLALARQLTDANPQQAEYRWGRRILFDYTNDDGVRLQGTLAIPDDYREGERRPMLVRFYEKYSQDLHRYPTVRYRHEPNFGDYVSHGYLVMQPDVHFRGGSSHSDMLECVEAATRKVIEMGYADPNAVGLSGHSYSGGGSSYIAARSDMFAAVASGAAPINLTSEFNQLFLGTGGNNHGYDIYGQGRYGTNPYDDPEVYAHESPITWVRDMDTPLLYLHGEEDQIVGYVQGMEWYNALRFNSKPIIFLSYPGEGHGLRKFENQFDFQRRLHQFFDHHLRDEAPAAWLVEGVPYLEKERRLRRRQ